MTALPSGPRSLVLTGLRYVLDPYASLLEPAARFGDPFTWPFAFGKLVITGSPEGARAVFTADARQFSAFGQERLGPIIGESNLFLLSGERHLRVRRLQSQPFNGERMRAYGQLMADVAEAHARRWTPGQVFDLHAVMQDISLDVILQAVLGLTEPERMARFKRALQEVSTLVKPSFILLQPLRHRMLGLSAWARFVDARERLRQLFFEELSLRRARPTPREDVLSLLIAARYEDGTAMTDEDLLIQSLNLVAVGQETTASSLAWAFYFSHKDRAVLARLRDEVATTHDPAVVAKLPFLDAVVSETLRLEPVAPLAIRTLGEPMDLLGHHLPPGTNVCVSSLLVHRREALYPDPTRFRPERFLERSYGPFEFLPFGGGIRRCLGAAFATHEMKLVLATILRGYTLELATTEPITSGVRGTTLGPRGGVPMVLHARR